VYINAGSTTVGVSGGSVSIPGGAVSLPQESGASITLEIGLTFNTPVGAEVVFDEDAPLGYRVDADNPFSDVKANDWFYGDEIFRPNLDITRQEPRPRRFCTDSSNRRKNKRPRLNLCITVKNPPHSNSAGGLKQLIKIFIKYIKNLSKRSGYIIDSRPGL
jgi:hypothetical protein